VESGDEVSTSEDENNLAVGDEREYGYDGLIFPRNLNDGIWLDEENPSDVDEEGTRLNFRERLGEEIAQYGANDHYPNGDMDEDDCAPICVCIVCTSKMGHRFVNPRYYAWLKGTYGGEEEAV